MSGRTRSFFSAVGRTLVGFEGAFATARELHDIYNTPESVFRARGTTRDAAIRAAAKRL